MSRSVFGATGTSLLALAVSSGAVLAEPPKPTTPPRGAEPSAASTYELVSKAVVTITVFDGGGQPTATGSGVIISSDGKVLTNYYVVAGGTFFDVRLLSQDDHSEPFPARPSACSSSADLAVLKIVPEHALPFAHLALELPKVGSRVYAVGSPLQLENTPAAGLVSQIRTIDDQVLIQTTAAVSPASSGGGLFLASGELVGITTMSLDAGQGLIFAVAVQHVGDLEPCKSFPAVSTEEAQAAPAPTLRPPDCKAHLKLERSNVLATPSGDLRVTGVVSNDGCGPAEGVHLKVDVSHTTGGRYITSKAFTLRADEVEPGALLNFDEEVKIPFSIGQKPVTVHFAVRELDEPLGSREPESCTAFDDFAGRLKAYMDEHKAALNEGQREVELKKPARLNEHYQNALRNLTLLLAKANEGRYKSLSSPLAEQTFSALRELTESYRAFCKMLQESPNLSQGGKGPTTDLGDDLKPRHDEKSLAEYLKKRDEVAKTLAESQRRFNSLYLGLQGVVFDSCPNLQDRAQRTVP